jgi:hypothetical protein
MVAAPRLRPANSYGSNHLCDVSSESVRENLAHAPDPRPAKTLVDSPRRLVQVLNVTITRRAWS